MNASEKLRTTHFAIIIHLGLLLVSTYGICRIFIFQIALPHEVGRGGYQTPYKVTQYWEVINSKEIEYRNPPDGVIPIDTDQLCEDSW
jgi:hypothetical protein